MTIRNLITFKEALERGRFKTTKAYRLINEGKLIAVKDGGRTLIEEDSLIAYQANLPRKMPHGGSTKNPAA